MANKLSVEKLRNECDSNLIQCPSTKDLTPLGEIIGQERAVRALKFGLGIRNHGFNMYVAGWPGTGRKTAVKNFVEAQAKIQPVPPDWCYVNNFGNQYEPKALQLPPGKGKEFRDDMKNFIESVKTALPKAFEGEDYAARREGTIRELEGKRKRLVEELNEKAQSEGFVIQSTPIGLLLIPVLDGKPLSEEEILSLPQKTRDRLQEKREQLETELRGTMRQIADMEKQIHDALRKLNREVALYAIGHLLERLNEKYGNLAEVTAHLKTVENDMLDNLQQFIRRGVGESQEQQFPFQLPWMRGEDPYKKYEVNVFIDNSETKGAPVVVETNPTYPNLLGRMEKEAQFGALITDFSMIRGGSIHKANGGYLIIPVE